MSERQRLGCPRCNSLELVVSAVMYENIEFYDDGTHEMNDVIDYGDALEVGCNSCGWTMGETPTALDLKRFNQAHADMIREEFLKVMQS